MMKPRGDRWLLIPLFAPLVALFIPFPCGAQAPSVTVTKYTYNADGALTSITATVDDGQPSMTYLVWDNFVPDTATGTMAVANGRLVGFGPDPGSLTTTFHFDVRDRLANVIADAQSEEYEYHAKGTMASSSTVGIGPIRAEGVGL